MQLSEEGGARIEALVGIVTSFSTNIALPFNRHWVLSSLGPLNILISSVESHVAAG
jgi:hypothetical protein